MQTKTLVVARDIRERLTLNKLKPRQRKFIIAYAGSGDVLQSVIDAGYSCKHVYQAKNTAYRLMQLPAVAENLELLELELESALIATTAECKARVTDVLRDPKTDIQHVLAAAKMLLQANGDLDPRIQLEIAQRTTVSHEHTIRLTDFAAPPSQRELESNEHLRIEYKKILEAQAAKAGLTVIPSDSLIEAEAPTIEDLM